MKTITVPKNTKAEQLLDIDKCPQELLEEINFSQGQFEKLWASGLFVHINEICQSLIDNYEDEVISNMESVPAVLNFIKENQWNEEVADLISQVVDMFVKAREYKTSIHFYF